MNHTLTFYEDIPLPNTANAAETAFVNANCRDTTWLTSNPLFRVWLQMVNLDPTQFAPTNETYFSINEATSLIEYQACIV